MMSTALKILERVSPAICLADYAPPSFLISQIDLDIDLREDHALVKARLQIVRNPMAQDPHAALQLDGIEIELITIKLNGETLKSSQYTVEPTQLVVPSVPDRALLETVVRLLPNQNTKLMGLYASKSGYFTQCEAEGFRRITYCLDRPDVMSRYTTTIHADKGRYPLLLSNGNRVDGGDEANGRHWAYWEDPFPKPCYLFAMVAAQLDRRDESFTTRSKRKVMLSVLVESGKLDQSGFAMEALKRAMRWDEQVFGLELDLDQYMIVAVAEFNSGAMENKGLNIFNTRYVLARPDTATDTDFMELDRVVAHEYFHNWTGNRVTCRDWFQLSLKEGLTKFRDREYIADTYSRTVERIRQVQALRGTQFPEDAGPMAHPVRPSSYVEISNFYTATVYDKGAEIVRMIHTLIGTPAFRKGMDLYFQRHDGQAVCIEEFTQAMEDVSGVDLAQFRRWYEQAGTPVVEATGSYDPLRQRYTLKLHQSCSPTPGQSEKWPLHVPIAMGLLDGNGNELPLQLEGETESPGTSRILSLQNSAAEFIFVNVSRAPVPSLLRGFSAPVKLRFDYSDAELALLMSHDADAFNRWDAGQRFAMNVLLKGVAQTKDGGRTTFPASLFDALRRTLRKATADPAFAAEALTFPTEGVIAEQMEEVAPEEIHAVRIELRRQVATQLRADFEEAYGKFGSPAEYSPDAPSAGKRALRNLCLGYLMELDDRRLRVQCLQEFESADNMTDAMAALTALANTDCTERDIALQLFYDKWKDEPLVLDKWFAVQAASRLPDTLAQVRKLIEHPGFTLRNPNRVRALIGTFCLANPVHFHAADGSGYEFAAAQVLALDTLNPQVAARLARAFDRWRKFDVRRRAHAQRALEHLRSTPNLSKDTSEIVTQALS